MLQTRRQYSTKHLFLAGGLILLTVLLLVAGSNYVLNQLSSNHINSSIPLKDGWKMRTGDSPFLLPGKPVWVISNEEPRWVPVHGQVLKSALGTDYIWFKVDVPTIKVEDPMLVIPEIQGVLEVYQDGREIYRSGDITKKSFQGQGEQLIRLPTDASDPTLFFRLYSYKGDPMLGKGMIVSESSFLYQCLLHDLKSGLILLMLFFIGLMSFTIYWLGWRKKIVMQLALLALSADCYLFASVHMGFAFLKMPLLYHYALCIGFALMVHFALIFFESVFGDTRPVLLRRLLQVQSVLLIGYVFVYLFLYQEVYPVYVQVFRVFLLVEMVVCMFIIFEAYRKRRDVEVQVFTLGFSQFILLSLKDTFFQLVELDTSRFPPIVRWIVHEPMVAYGLLALVVTLAFILVHRANSTASRLKAMSDAYSRFVPTELLQHLNKENIWEVELGDAQRKEMTILFSDIRSFTTLSETMSPEDNFAFLNGYLGQMEPAIKQHHGFIDKYIGDEIMALFDREPDDAVQAALKMLTLLRPFNAQRLSVGRIPVTIGIGLNTGPTVLGIIGGPTRMEGTVISDAVNLASRMENLNKEYGTELLISEQTYRALQHPEKFLVRKVDRVQVKGKSTTVSVYEVFNCDPLEQRHFKQKTLPLFTEALDLYELGRYSEAHERFAACARLNPDDGVVQIYLQRCQKLVEFKTS